MVAVKTRWSDEVKLSKAKDSPTAPFPVTLQRTIPKPEAASAFDVEELRLQLLVASSDRATMPISVQVAGELPPTVQKRIAAHVERGGAGRSRRAARRRGGCSRRSSAGRRALRRPALAQATYVEHCEAATTRG